MTAYGAVISLKNTIHHILHSPRLSLADSSIEVLQFAYDELQPLQEILERLDSTSKAKSRTKVNALDGRIRETLCQFEDLLESLVSDFITSQTEICGSDLVEQRRKHSSKRRMLCEESLASSSTSRSSYGSERDVMLFNIDLQRLQDNIHSFILTLKDIKEDYIYQVDNMPDDEDDDEDDSACISSSTSNAAAATFGETKSKMIGLSDQFESVKRYFIPKKYDNTITLAKRLQVCALVAMAGIGKTTLAKEIFQDPSISSHFEHRAWVTVGRKPQLIEILQGILAQLNPEKRLLEKIGGHLRERLEGKKELLEAVGSVLKEKEQSIIRLVGKMCHYMEEKLDGNRCLIVLDDVWETTVLDALLNSVPDMKNGTIQLVCTARDRNVFEKIDPKVWNYLYLEVRFLNVEESKELLCQKVFGENIICPYQLDKAATKVAKKCEGLPLTIVIVADHLSKAQNRDDPEYWEDVAEERNSVFTDAYDEMSKVLFPSYNYLPHPQHVKMPLLSLGVFPPDYGIPPSEIIHVLSSEGWFFDKSLKRTLEGSVWGCFVELCCFQNLVLFYQERILLGNKDDASRFFKTCRLHSSWRHLCRREAKKNKFYHVLNKLVDVTGDDIKRQRCLSLQNNLLFGIKDFCDLVTSSNCAATTRCLLFFGPYQQYPTPIDAIGFKLLRELNALQLRFYTFPTQVLTLVQLKYLALTCNGQLPPTISKLFNLKVLIVHPHMSITKCCDMTSSYIPIEIWDMTELEHIEILGNSFVVAPPNDDYDDVASLEKLSTLVGVNADNICTISELPSRIPNIKKLGVQIKVMPSCHNDSELLSCFAHISTLASLETLKCSIINPPVEHDQYVVPVTPSPLMLPSGLKRLHLSGMGFPWEYMDVIGWLPCLQVLKLRSYAFRGSKWETQKYSFKRLQYLLIEDSDLVEWKPASGSFGFLMKLSLKHCYKLQELQWPSTWMTAKIEVVDCNPLAFTSAHKLVTGRGSRLDFSGSSSFQDKPMIIEFKRNKGISQRLE